MIANRHLRRRGALERRYVRASNGPAFSHIIFVFAALIALTTQVWLVQSHIHLARAASGSIVAASTPTETSADKRLAAVRQIAPQPSDKRPINEEPSNCPLCQAFLYSGHYIQSDAILAIALFIAGTSFPVLDDALSSAFAVSHIWQGRAPPSA